MNSELNSLLGGSSSAGGASTPSLFAVPAGLATLFSVFMVLTSIASIVILVFYIMNALITYKAHRATIETRDILREINERDKARSSKVVSQQAESVAQATTVSTDTTATSAGTSTLS